MALDQAPRKQLGGVLGAVALFLAAVVLPLVPWLADTPLVGSTYGKQGQLFELFGLTAGAALLALAVRSVLRSRDASLVARLVALAPLAVALYWVSFVSEFATFPGDWGTYQRGAMAIASGRPLYSEETIYLFYPPLTAEVVLLVYRAVAAALSWAARGPDAEQAWWVTFYLFQAAQLGLIILAYPLTLSFVRRSGLRSDWAHALTAAVLVLNNPLLRTVRWAQINLWVLDLALLGVFFAPRAPALAGIALALAIHIKVYPVILLVPLAVMGLWRVVLWTGAGAAGVVLAEIVLGGGAHWQQFFAFVPHWPQFMAFRSNSLLSPVGNTLRIVFGVEGAALAVATRIVVAAATVAALAWLGARIVARERLARASVSGALPGERRTVDERRLAGHVADALAFGLVISPVAWEHHYIFTIPLVLFAVAAIGRRAPLPAVVGAILTLGFPTFDVFPASYVRLAGVVTLLLFTAPRQLEPPGDAGAAAA